MFEFFKRKTSDSESPETVPDPVPDALTAGEAAESTVPAAADPKPDTAGKPETGSRKTAVAFVDYEYWYVALDRHYHTRPNLSAWKAELCEKYDLKDLVVYGNFANNSLRAELPAIGEVAEHVVETQVPFRSHKKDQTEFLLLNGIYQRALTDPSIEAYVLFSGDGHFAPALEFLRDECGKTIDVYAVRDSYSRQLIAAATVSTLTPEEVDWTAKCANMILTNLKYLEANAIGDKPVRPSFRATVDAVSRYRHLPKADVEQTLCWMLDNGYAEQYVEYLDEKDVRLIRVNWEKCSEAGLYVPIAADERVPEFVEEPLNEEEEEEIPF